MKVMKLLMDDAGVTQRELSERAGINPAKVSWMMHNGVNPRGKEARRLAEALGYGGDPAVLTCEVPTRDVLAICEREVQR